MMEHNTSTIDKGLFVLTALYAFTALISTAASYAWEAIGLLLLLLSYKEWPLWWQNNRPLFAGIGIYIAGLLITSFTAINKMLAGEAIKGQLEPMVLLFMVLAVQWNKRRIAIVAGMLAAGLFVNDCYAFYQWIFLAHDRPPGFVKQSAVLFAECIALLLPICYLCFLRAANIVMTAVSTILLLFTGVLMIANSVKMVWIVTTLALLVLTLWFFFFSSRAKSSKKLLVLPILLVGMVGAFLLSPIVQQRVALAVNQPSSFLEQRIIMWDMGKRIFLDHPVFGVGPGNYGPEKYPYLDRYHSGATFDRHIINSHNIITQTISEQGCVGIISLLALISGIVVTGLQFKNSSQQIWGIGVLVLTGCLLATGMSEYTMGYRPLMRLYWFLLGVLISAAWIGRESVYKGARFR